MKRMRSRWVMLGALLALALLVGTVSAGRLADAGEPASEPAQAAATTAPQEPHPLAAGTTPENVQLAVFERAYSECSKTSLALLRSKYKIAATSLEGVAAIVGRAWASYFNAGRDAVRDGQDGCLQGAASS